MCLAVNLKHCGICVCIRFARCANSALNLSVVGKFVLAVTSYDLLTRGQVESAIFPKIAKELAYVNSILIMKYEVTNKNFSFYIHFFMRLRIQSEHYFRSQRTMYFN